MKKWLAVWMAVLMCFGACAAAENADPAAAAAETAAEETAPLVPDLDLSTMSGTFVYAQIYQMTVDPYTYVDKIIRLSGYYDYFEDASTGMVYTACVVPDATACCSQGIEFVWAGEHVYPDEYPERGTDLTVTGRFELYQEGEYMFIHLADAEVEWHEAET